MNTRKIVTISTVVVLILSVFTAVSMTSVMGVPPPPNKFLGNVSLNYSNATVGTVINAWIDADDDGTGDELRGSIEVVTAGSYGVPGFVHLSVNGTESDNGKTIIFYVDGVKANETAEWKYMSPSRQLDLGAAGEPSEPEPTPSPTATESGGDSPGGGGPGGGPTDSDGDGYSDLDEIIAGTDPNDPNSYPGSSAEPPAATETATAEATPGEEPGNVVNWYMIIGAIVLLLIGLAVVYLYMQKE